MPKQLSELLSKARRLEYENPLSGLLGSVLLVSSRVQFHVN